MSTISLLVSSAPLFIIAALVLRDYLPRKSRTIPPLIPRTPPAIPPPPGPVLSLLGTNDVPHDADIPLVKEYILTLRKHLRRWDVTHIKVLPPESPLVQKYEGVLRWYDEEKQPGSSEGFLHMSRYLHGLPPPLSQLIRERELLENSIDLHRGILSPIRRLPPELITSILRLAASPIPDLQHHPPLHLTHICGRWRACAIQDASFWSTIVIYIPRDPTSRREVPIAMLQRQLALSGDAPLHIHLILSTTHDRMSDHFWDLFNALLDRCSHWDHLTLQGDFNPLFRFPVPLYLPRLRRLDVDVTNIWLDGLDSPLDCFANTPNLREVFLAQQALLLPSDARTQPTRIPTIAWEQITRYRALLHATTHLDILRRAQNLRECGLYLREPPSVIRGPRIHLHALRRLHVDDAIFLDAIDAPALEELIVKHSACSHVLPFLRRSNAVRLRSLTILHAHALPSIIDILDFCSSSLQHLCIPVAFGAPSPSADLHIATVLAALQDTSICPSLASLFCVDTNPTPGEFDYTDALYDFVAVRRRATRLRLVRIFVEGGSRRDPRVRWFRTAEYDGFDVRMHGLYEGGPPGAFVEAVNPP
ncbi:hypothetical protein R3P38DRAFT_1764164 [Favolaschia claudopus]|uniref:F-box domain-containing protein n=1 Tax=Favolaschia claudopus TaxID=2862362 RepID=A0AAW0DDC6_9AGAR